LYADMTTNEQDRVIEAARELAVQMGSP